eukprot:gnl/MRDRNA2_/MRDRNA2_65746_c0_seq1.p1 gnl/MRDRNA2_/MRDRNA2_65746_c0~~gnl/MRDRNA2_/MRDRNA2_65746_c0_seq1.p1  ORF type:complete len:166 (-),score=27.36 gnl/MRDRNA2_/MRDRNA2_65746_c0_seq1:63-560(-)
MSVMEVWIRIGFILVICAEHFLADHSAELADRALKAWQRDMTNLDDTVLTKGGQIRSYLRTTLFQSAPRQAAPPKSPPKEVMRQDPDGSIWKIIPDGTQVQTFPDGTERHTFVDGSIARFDSSGNLVGFGPEPKKKKEGYDGRLPFFNPPKPRPRVTLPPDVIEN